MPRQRTPDAVPLGRKPRAVRFVRVVGVGVCLKAWMGLPLQIALSLSAHCKSNNLIPATSPNRALHPFYGAAPATCTVGAVVVFTRVRIVQWFFQGMQNTVIFHFTLVAIKVIDFAVWPGSGAGGGMWVRRFVPGRGGGEGKRRAGGSFQNSVLGLHRGWRSVGWNAGESVSGGGSQSRPAVAKALRQRCLWCSSGFPPTRVTRGVRTESLAVATGPFRHQQLGQTIARLLANQPRLWNDKEHGHGRISRQDGRINGIEILIIPPFPSENT